MSEQAGTYEEWRVTGQPGAGYPPYEYTWSRRLNPHMLDAPEVAARGFVEQIRTSDCAPWEDGPHLSKRVVTITEWQSQ